MRYRKKPVEIEAVQYTGKNYTEIMIFVKNSCYFGPYADGTHELFIRTLEGTMHASVGDYIIKGVDGEFYPCKPDIFEKTYDRVEI